MPKLLNTKLSFKRMAEVITKAFYTSFVVWRLNSVNMFDSSIISFNTGS